MKSDGRCDPLAYAPAGASGFGRGQVGHAQARLTEPMAALRLTLPLIGPGATAATSRLGRSKLKHAAVAQGGNREARSPRQRPTEER
jgi:hypothetical protein